MKTSYTQRNHMSSNHVSEQWSRMELQMHHDALVGDGQIVPHCLGLRGLALKAMTMSLGPKPLAFSWAEVSGGLSFCQVHW